MFKCLASRGDTAALLLGLVATLFRSANGIESFKINDENMLVKRIRKSRVGRMQV